MDLKKLPNFKYDPVSGELEKILDQDIPKKNKNNSSELEEDEFYAEELVGQKKPKQVLSLPSSDNVYEAYTNQGKQYVDNSLRNASDNTNLHGKFINQDGELADIKNSSFSSKGWLRISDAKMFGGNGLVYLSQSARSPSDIQDAVIGVPIVEGIAKMAQNFKNQYDDKTVYNMLIPGIDPRNGQPILKEVVGTFKDFQEKEIAITSKYGFAKEDSGYFGLAAFHNSFLNSMATADEVFFGAVSLMGMDPRYHGMGLAAKELHQKAIDKNDKMSYIASESAGDSWSSLDWFASGTGNAMGSIVQFGQFGRGAKLLTMGGLKLAGKVASKDFSKDLAKRKAMENIASWGGSAMIGYGHAMGEARRSGLNDHEAYVFALTVGTVNTLVEKLINVEFDDMMMGSSAKYLTKRILAEMGGETSDAAIRSASRSVFKTVLSGGGTMLKAGVGESVEEIIQTVNEQGMRTFHDMLFGEGRNFGEGKFEETGFDLDQILQAGFFGAIGAMPMSMGGMIANMGQSDSFSNKLITDGKGKLILDGLAELKAAGKISDAKFKEESQKVRLKMDIYDKERQLFSSIQGQTRHDEMRNHIMTMLSLRATYQGMVDEHTSQLAVNTNLSPDEAKAFAEKKRKAIDKIQESMLKVNEVIDIYRTDKGIRDQNAKIEKVIKDGEQARDSVFGNLIEGDISLASVQAILTRHNAMSIDQQEKTFMGRTASEMEMLVRAINSGELQKLVGDEKFEEFKTRISEDLSRSNFYLHPSINTDANRSLLTGELGIDENSLPLTASELERAQTNPSEFSKRYKSTDQILDIINGKDFEDSLRDYIKSKYGKDLDKLTEPERNLYEMEHLFSHKNKFGLTDGMIHSANQYAETMALLDDDSKTAALQQMMDSSDKPISLLTRQKSIGTNTAGFHQASAGNVMLLFDKKRLQELRGKRDTVGLTNAESKELTALQEDLFHKLTHETVHNLFDAAIADMHKDFMKYKMSGGKEKTQNALLFERIYNLSNLAFQGLASHKDANEFYFFNSIMVEHSKLDPANAIMEADKVVKEFFAETLSNRSFQEALDSYNINGKQNRKAVSGLYNYNRIEKFTFKSLLSEVLDVFSSVFNKIKESLSPKTRTILSEALALANPISFNKFYQYQGESIPGIESMDISDYNPAMLIDNEQVFIDWTMVPASILHRLASRNYNIRPQDAQMFEDRIADFLIKTVLKDGDDGLPIDTLKVIYFGSTDSFLISWQEYGDNDQVLNKRQFFNRYGQEENLNTNVFNTVDSNSLKKPYSITDFAPENDSSIEAQEKRKIANSYMRALEEGFNGQAFLNLNREKVFGYNDQAFRGEIEIVYTFDDGSKAVIGFVPDLAKMRLSRLLSGNATIPVKVIASGVGSAVFIKYNIDGDPTSGIKRVINAKDYNYNLPQDLADQGYSLLSSRTSAYGFMPRTDFTFGEDIEIDNSSKVKADDADSFTNKDETMSVVVTGIPSAEQSDTAKRKRMEEDFKAVVDPGFSFYTDLDRRKPFEERAWHVRDVIARNIKYKIMTGFYNTKQLENALKILVEKANELVLTPALDDSVEPARAENLGFLTKKGSDDFIESIISKEAIDIALSESNESIQQDWDGHGLNPNSTVFGMVRAQLEQITYFNPETGRSQVLDYSDAKDVLFDSSRKSVSFSEMVMNLKKISSDDKFTRKEKSVAKALYNYYSSNLVYPKALGLIDINGVELDHLLSNQIANAAADNSNGTSDFKTKLLDIAKSGIVIDGFGNEVKIDKEIVTNTAQSLYAYYTSSEANFLNLVVRYGANSLYTSFASLRRVDSVTMTPNEWDGGFLSYNGNKKLKEKFKESMIKGIEDAVSNIKADKNLTSDQKVLKFHQSIVDKYTEMFGVPSFTAAEVGKLFFKIQNNLDPKSTGLKGYHAGNGINALFMQTATPQVFNETVNFLQAFYASIGMEIPLGMLQRYEDQNAVMRQGLKVKESEFNEFLFENDIETGTPEYEKALAEYEADVVKFQNLFKDQNYAYSTSYFGKSENKGQRSTSSNYPTMSLLAQGAFFLNSKAFSSIKNNTKADFENAEIRKISDEVLFYNNSSQSDEFYFDPKGEKRFSVKVKSGADKLFEDLTDNKDGLRSVMMNSKAWKRNRVLQSIDRNHGKPIDVVISGIRNGFEGNAYTDSSDLDFAFSNLAGFISFYDYDDSYIHIDDIPSDKPTIYGYKLERVDPANLQAAIDDIVSYEREKIEREKLQVTQVFTPAIFRPNGNPVPIAKKKTAEAQAKVDLKFKQLINGVHYIKSGDGYLPGRMFDTSKAFYGLPENSKEISLAIKKEGKELYDKLVSMGFKSPVNRKFMEANNPRYKISQLEKELNFAELQLKSSENPTLEMSEEISAFKNAIDEASQRLPEDIKSYQSKLEEQREKIFVNEFYPTHTINRFHLSQLKMGDYAYYKDDFFSDLNKRMAGPSAPFYRGAWSRKTANLIAIDDPGMKGDKTFIDLPILKQGDDGVWRIDSSNLNTIESARTDAQGYVTEQFADEMVKAYGSFSGFKKIFKPVMFGMNKQNGDLNRAKPTYLKLSTAIILDPNNPKNADHYAKFPNQLALAQKVYASGGDIALFNSGFKVGYHTGNNIDADQFQTQILDLDLFGLQNDPEHSVGNDGSTNSAGVQIHKQLADNGNFQEMIEYYTLEATMLRSSLDKAEKLGLSNIKQVKEAFERELGKRAHTGPIAEWLKDTITPILDHPFTSEMAQNMVGSLFNKLGSLPKHPGEKYINLSDYGFDQIVLTEDQLTQRKALIEQIVTDFQGAENYTLKWAGPRTVEGLHEIDAKLFSLKVKAGDWRVNEDSGIIENSNGQPVIFPSDVLIPENSKYKIGDKVISTRIPTTGKASSIAGRVVGTIPSELGNVIVTPKEGPGILGFDFDVDGLFTWHHTGGLEREMDMMFSIAFNVLIDAKNYNEVTTPVSTDILGENAFFYSLSEEQAEIWDNMSPSERKAEMKSPNSLKVQYPHSQWGFARQLQLMKLNTVGKGFIGSSASYFGIYSVFSQTDTRLLSTSKTTRAYNIDGASIGYPSKSSDGQMVSNAFVQLINGATDNVKLMVLGRNNINLITGDVMMDMVSHGVSLDYALAFINQPAVRDIVRTTEKLGSMVVEKDSTPAITQLTASYKRILNIVDPNFKYQDAINSFNGKSDRVKFTKEKLDEMYRNGNKNMSIDMVKNLDDVYAMFGNKIPEGQDKRSTVAKIIADQITIIEKFQYYKELASVTRQGGKLAMMYSKNPKNYLELRKIKNDIDKVFNSEKPKLSRGIFSHPSYKFQYELISKMINFYRDNKITASEGFEFHFEGYLETMNEKEQKRFHDHFYNNIMFSTLFRSDIDSSILTGQPLTSVEFNEIFVRLVNDNQVELSENRFMSLLTAEINNTPVTKLGMGEGQLSKLSFRGLKDFGDVELQEIQKSFFDIPDVQYNGQTVDVKKALIYYLGINKGFALGGFSYSKILPKAVLDQFSVDLNGVLEAINSTEFIIEENTTSVDERMLVPIDRFADDFFERNTDLYPKVMGANLVSMTKNVPYNHSDIANKTVNPYADYTTGIKIETNENGLKTVQIEANQMKRNPILKNFITKAINKNGFVILSNDKVIYYKLKEAAAKENDNNGREMLSSTTFIETKKVNRRHDIYEPEMLGEPSTEVYTPQAKVEVQAAQEIDPTTLIEINRWSIVDGNSQQFNELEIVKSQAVVELVDPERKSLLESLGYKATRENPDVYYNPKRDPNTYTEEQIKKLKNEC